jgi:hypothetical protein
VAAKTSPATSAFPQSSVPQFAADPVQQESNCSKDGCIDEVVAKRVECKERVEQSLIQNLRRPHAKVGPEDGGHVLRRDRKRPFQVHVEIGIRSTFHWATISPGKPLSSGAIAARNAQSWL